jgi:hypothetical protein
MSEFKLKMIAKSQRGGQSESGEREQNEESISEAIEFLPL